MTIPQMRLFLKEGSAAEEISHKQLAHAVALTLFGSGE